MRNDRQASESLTASPQSPVSEPMEERDIARKTRRSLIASVLGAGAAVAAWQWIRTRPQEDDLVWPLRRVHEFNGKISQAVFRPSSRTRVYPFGSAPTNPRVNGRHGLRSAIDLSAWKLRIAGLAERDVIFTLEQIKQLPRADLTMQLCCIEGWSILVNWSGVRFIDLLKALPVGSSINPDALPPYVSMTTPDDEYYVGLDTPSALHPQTLLAYEIDNQPLTIDHGAPLRLVIPCKYGIKNIKRIGTIAFTHDRPRDYWADRGYDWYSGL